MNNKRDKNLTTKSKLCLLIVWLSSPMLAMAEPAAEAMADPVSGVPEGVDISGWVCEYCVFEQGLSGDIELGLGSVSDSSFKFGEYNGLYDQGAFLIANANVRYRDEDASYYNLRVRDLGLNTRKVEVDGGQQGSYRIFLNYDEIAHYISDSAKTPYLGNGSDSLTLPAGWVDSSSTSGMTELNASLRGVDLYNQRKRLTVGADVILSNRWQTAFDVRHEERDGQKRSGGAFLFKSAQLVEPIDYTTDELDFSASYNTQKWQSTLAYYGSFFSNENASLNWQNAFTPNVAGADAGQRALAPDNQFHQFLFTSAYKLTHSTRLSGDIALGRMLQNEDLLGATINPNFAVALPTNSANARIDTLTANLKLDSAVTDKLQLSAALRYDDRDNKTPSNVYDWVTTDSFAAAPRSNLPYSFTNQSIKLGADYRFNRANRLSGGYDYEKVSRTNQEVDDTKEDTLWAKYNLRPAEKMDVTLKAAHGVRDASGYNPVVDTVPAQNTLLIKYNMADRIRDTGGIQVNYNPGERISFGLGAELSRDDYSDSTLGLTESRDTTYNADIAMVLTEVTTGHAFAARQLIKSQQAGSQTFTTPDWTANNDDTIDTLGIGIKHQMIVDKLDIGADFVKTRSSGKVNVITGVLPSAFPDNDTDLDSLKLYADYKIEDNMLLHAAYWYERYRSTDWALDNVDPDTISNVISFGETAPNYNVNVIMVSMSYLF